MKKLWKKFFPKKEQPWKTDVYFGIPYYEKFRGHLVASGSKVVGDKLIEGEVYYLRDVCGNVLINKDEGGNSLL